MENPDNWTNLPMFSRLHLRVQDVRKAYTS